MFAVRDKERPEVGALTNYFRSREEAEEYVGTCTRHSREGVEQGAEYLEIVEVDRVSRPCVFCGTEVQTDPEKYPDTDFCRWCYYSGTLHERRTCAEILGRIGALDGVASAEVWHTGGGCFNLAIRLDDGRLLTPAYGDRSEDSGEVWPDAFLPDEEKGERWCLVVSESEEAWSEWDDEDGKVKVLDALYTGDQLVSAIRTLIEGGVR